MKLVLDTGIVIAYAAEEKDKSLESIENIFDLTKGRKIESAISSITLSELYTHFIRKKDPRKAVETSVRLEEIGVNAIDVNKEIAKSSGDLKTKYKMLFADAIILASCIAANGILITYDPEFSDVKEVRILKPEEFIREMKQDKQDKYLRPKNLSR